MPSSLSARFKTLLPAVWVILLMGYVLVGTPDVPFHGDEATQIYMSRDYAYQFIDRDWERLAYSDNPASPTEQQLRLINGTVNKYLIGAAWHSFGLNISDINEQWDWGADWNYNQTTGHAPDERLLRLARWPSALLLAVGVAVMFGVGRSVGGRWTPYLASLYYALNPALLLNGRRAMMEGSFICFSLLVVLVGIWLLKEPSLRRTILLGLVSGFALASKHTAVFTVGTVFMAVLVYLMYQSLRAEDDNSVVDYVLLPYLGIAAVITLSIFYALNPAWWSDPAARAQNVLQLRQELLAGQTAAFGGYSGLADQLGGFFRQGLMVLPQYYEVQGWERFISDPISRYEASVWRGVSIGGSVVGALAVCGIMAAGAWSFIPAGLRTRLAAGWRDAEAEDTQPAPTIGALWLVGVWIVVMLLSTLLLTPLEWQRYYLPVYPAIGLLAAVGLNSAVSRFVLVRQRRPRGKPPLSGDDSRPDTLPELS